LEILEKKADRYIDGNTFIDHGYQPDQMAIRDGIIITPAGYATGFLTGFLLAIAVTTVFPYPSGTGLHEKS